MVHALNVCASCPPFGIVKEAIVLMTDSNEPRLEDHSAWCRQREEIELTVHSSSSSNHHTTGSDADSTSEIIIVPRPSDVLFGPGSRKNKGNIIMRNLVVGMLDEHNESRKGRKMQLNENVVDEIKKQGGRFLKQNEGTKEWEEASDMDVSRKIAHTFRNIRRPSRITKKPTRS